MSKTIYVGRIPFDYTEEQVASIFQSAGPIQEIRFVFDKETGKSKGFAFVEYFDAESAASAVRNLDNHPVGNMKLKVDFSNDGGGNQNNQAGQTAFEYIARVVNEMDPGQKRELISDFKTFTTESRTQALELLQHSPQIAYALVQAMLETGKIDQKHTEALLPAGMQQPKDQKKNKPKKQTKGAGRPNASRQGTPQVSTSAETTPAAPSSAAMETAASHTTPQDPDEIAMIRQVMAFTDSQVNSLPQEQRQMVLEIRAKVKRGEIRI